MVAKPELLEFVAVMAQVGRDDRDLYRQLRAEAWAMVQENHREQSPREKAKWLTNAS
jgi:hypothetical protein